MKNVQVQVQVLETLYYYIQIVFGFLHFILDFKLLYIKSLRIAVRLF
jgi:hypothetical protein